MLISKKNILKILLLLLIHSSHTAHSSSSESSQSLPDDDSSFSSHTSFSSSEELDTQEYDFFIDMFKAPLTQEEIHNQTSQETTITTKDTTGLDIILTSKKRQKDII